MTRPYPLRGPQLTKIPYGGPLKEGQSAVCRKGKHTVCSSLACQCRCHEAVKTVLSMGVGMCLLFLMGCGTTPAPSVTLEPVEIVGIATPLVEHGQLVRSSDEPSPSILRDQQAQEEAFFQDWTWFHWILLILSSLGIGLLAWAWTSWQIFQEEAKRWP